jgi:UDP-N-acetylglucosamine transferase subunit ALG13
VSVGTDFHPFDRLCRWVDGWLAAGGGTAARCFVQSGTSTPPSGAEHEQYLGYPEMERMIREATVVVCHGGPGTIMLASTLGKRPIVVPRRKAEGEHVDDHQCQFARRIAAGGAIVLAETEDAFRGYVDGVLRRNGDDPLPPRSEHAADAVARFERLVDGLFER